MADPVPISLLSTDKYQDILGMAFATPDFWSYYGPWATAYASYYNFGVDSTSPLASNLAGRTIATPEDWQAWLPLVDNPPPVTATLRPMPATAPPPPPPPPPVAHTVTSALGAMWGDVKSVWAWLKAKL